MHCLMPSTQFSPSKCTVWTLSQAASRPWVIWRPSRNSPMHPEPRISSSSRRKRENHVAYQQHWRRAKVANPSVRTGRIADVHSAPPKGQPATATGMIVVGQARKPSLGCKR